MDEELKKLLRDTLERNRAFVAGMAFGVPAESALEYTDAIVNDLVRVIKPLLEQVIDPGGIFDAFAKDNDASDNVDQQHP
jgi:hypothetical protein